MSAKHGNAIIAAFTSALYVGTVVFGLHVQSLSVFWPAEKPKRKMDWQPPSFASIPKGPPGG